MDALGEASPSSLPAPASGEALAVYTRRIIADDVEFRRLQSSARGLRFDISVPSFFRPAFLNKDAVEAFYGALSGSKLDPRVEGFSRLLDHLWIGRNPLVLPLDLRMAAVANPRPLSTPEFTFKPAQVTALRLAVKAGRFRDGRIAQLCDSLRSGNWQAAGFLPGDAQRSMVSLPTAWWGDEHMQCDWRKGELRPADAVNGDRPVFLGVTLSPKIPAPVGASNAASVWMQENVKEPGKWKRDTAIADCSKATGVTYREARIAWKQLPAALRGSRGRHK